MAQYVGRGAAAASMRGQTADGPDASGEASGPVTRDSGAQRYCTTAAMASMSAGIPPSQSKLSAVGGDTDDTVTGSYT